MTPEDNKEKVNYRLKQESLLTLAIAAISAGITQVTTDLTVGLVLIGTGVILVILRGFNKDKS